MITEDFESFLSAHESRIYHYLINLLGNENDAADVLQEAFIAFYTHLERIDKGSALAYLYKIAYNKALTFRKQKHRFRLIPPYHFHNMPDIPYQEKEADFSALHLALKELPPKLAAVIHLQYYEKMSYKEIAAELGYSLKAVESLIVRAKKILRKKIMQDSQSRGV